MDSETEIVPISDRPRYLANRKAQKKFAQEHPREDDFLRYYRLLRTFPDSLSREEALEEIESELPVDLQQRLAAFEDYCLGLGAEELAKM